MTVTDEARTSGRTLPAPLAVRITASYDDVPLAQALDDVAKRARLGLAYADDIARAPRARFRADGLPAGDVIVRLTRGSGWTAWVDAEGQVVVRRDAPRASAPPARRPRLSGYVRRADSREVIRYANLVAADDSARAQSNADGFYFLRLNARSHRVQVRALGYLPLDTVVNLTDDATHDFFLTASALALETVKIDASAGRSDIDPETPEMSVARLDLATVKRAPAVLGEVDPIRSLTLLPGVSRTSDFTTAYSVRGGSADQNLILLDESTIYNPAHILGFLSVFNSDAVDDITLYKGAIPARYGGRLSSVLDVRQREGNANAFAGSASIGLLATRVVAEGPLPSKRGSFLVAARRSYADLFVGAARDEEIRDSKAYFYDINAKVNVPLGRTGTLMASGYGGRDVFSQSDDFGAAWGNGSATLRWNQVFANRLLSKVSLNATKYGSSLNFDLLDDRVWWRSRIRSSSARVDETLHLGAHNTLEFGAEVASLGVRPGSLRARDTTRIRPVVVETRTGYLPAAYLGHEVELSRRLSVRYGARWSGFTRTAPATVYRYAGDAPVVWNASLGRYDEGQLLDSTKYSSGNVVKRYSGLEPRASLRFGLTSHASLKASYARTRQYLLQASRTNTPTPLDVWEPVGRYLKPQHADQYALGYAATTATGGYEWSAETYFKRLTNVVDFVDGVDVVLNSRLETAMIQGEGRAYGLELFARKQSGKLTGWVSYTAARAEQRFVAGADGKGGINGGAWYRAPADKTHDLSIVALHPLGKRWTIGSTFSAASGLPVTYPVSRYEVDQLVIAEYGPRNAFRLPFYHRLDVSFTRSGPRSELQLGLYNLYNRYNAQSMAFRQNVDQPRRTEAVQLSVFGIVPSVSYTWRF